MADLNINTDFLPKDKLFPEGNITSRDILNAAGMCETPFYFYDGSMIERQCSTLTGMPNAFGINVRYAIKANPSRAVLELIKKQGMMFDAGSLNEAARACIAGISFNKILLTSQDVPHGEDLILLQNMMKKGLKYTVCSFLQLKNIASFVIKNKIDLSIRIHPGQGSGASATRNTGDHYASFGVQESELPKVLSFAEENNIKFTRIHVHIGSGSNPEDWKKNVNKTLSTVERFFPDVRIINLGGGFKVARMPDETAADTTELGEYTKEKFINFYRQTGRKIILEIEPGTYAVANSGYLVTSVIDIKPNKDETFWFFLLNGGMESNPRPLMYGARHPFYIVAKHGNLLWSDYMSSANSSVPGVIVGRCCETGDSQCLNEDGTVAPRAMVKPETGDYIIIGGTGAYSSSLAPFNYNSYLQAAELMLTSEGEIKIIRKPQSLEQLLINESGLEG
ncbi:diaminopimelate decarboxylase [bacterium]|nr:diaminopimelate decarboxylase [bacterium]